jgi:hypothetical protein
LFSGSLDQEPPFMKPPVSASNAAGAAAAIENEGGATGRSSREHVWSTHRHGSELGSLRRRPGGRRGRHATPQQGLRPEKPSGRDPWRCGLKMAIASPAFAQRRDRADQSPDARRRPVRGEWVKSTLGRHPATGSGWLPSARTLSIGRRAAQAFVQARTPTTSR